MVISAQTPATPVINLSQDSWDPLLITLLSNTGTPSTVTVTIRVIDIIDNDEYNRNFKEFQVIVNLKTVASPVLSLSTDIILEGSSVNQIPRKF